MANQNQKVLFKWLVVGELFSAMANRLRVMNFVFLSVVILGTIIIVGFLFATSTKSRMFIKQFRTLIEIKKFERSRIPVDISYLTDDFLHNNRNGTYPSLLPCPYTHLRKAPPKGTKTGINEANVSCLIHKSSDGACNDAAEYFGKPNQKLDDRKCDEAHYPDICKFVTTENSFSLKCDPKVCKSDKISIAFIDDSIGIIVKWEEINPFSTYKVKEIVDRKMSQNHTFCYLKCGSILQVLIFPPKILRNKTVKEEKKINVNIIVLDSISRPHFFRQMRESVPAMRKVIYDESIEATVLDFELFQSISMHTFDNIRPLFSGIVQGNDDFSSASSSLKPLGIHILSNEFKKYGYQTIFQEDLCWHDSWGIMLNNLIRTDGAINEKTWKRFKDIVKQHNIEHIGVTHFSCEVFKKYGLTNHYDRPSQVCLNGQFFNGYFLRYIKTLVQMIQNSVDAAPLLLYQHFNSAHTNTGSRIRNDDSGLADFILSMARDPNSLTMILSDHGHTRTGYGQTDEGKRELYYPHLFMIVPYYVAGLLGKQRMEALVLNQKRLLTTFDLHKALITLHDEKKKFSTDYKVNGVFSKIPANRTCSDLPLMPLARCQCEGADSKVQDNSNSHRWLAEFALGSLNNIIQNQYSKGINKSASSVLKGFGNCVRLVGTSFRNIIQSRTGKLTMLDLHIGSKNIGLKEDEVFNVAVEINNEIPTLKSYVRHTLYNKFKGCFDKTVDLKICACDKSKPSKTNGIPHVLKPKEMKRLVSSPMFDSETKIKDLHGGCLYQITRHHSSKISIAYEVANSCQRKTFKVSVKGTVYYVFLSRSLPFDLTVEPNSIYFMFSAVRQILNHSHMDVTISATEL